MVTATCFAYLASPVDAVPLNPALLNTPASPLPIHLLYNHSQHNLLVKQVFGDDSPSVEQLIEAELGGSVVYVGVGIEKYNLLRGGAIGILIYRTSRPIFAELQNLDTYF